jgi:hypothetical protein
MLNEGKRCQEPARYCARHILLRGHYAYCEVCCLALATIGFSGCGVAGSSPTFAPKASKTADYQRSSWMEPAASGTDLLYIADPDIGALTVYSYTPPNYALVGVLATPRNAEGVCVDRAQNVFTPAEAGEGHGAVVEYAHGGTTPIAILGGIPGTVENCAVDETAGTLAVPAIPADATYGQHLPQVAFLKNAKGTPSLISLPKGYALLTQCAYDGSGNFFVSAYVGAQSGDKYALLELPKGRKQFVPITLDQAILFPFSGGVFWDGKYLDIADPSQDLIYQFAISGKAGTLKAKVTLEKSYDITGFFIDGDKLIAPAFSLPGNGPSGVGIVNIYNYPAGGKKVGAITGVEYPAGLVVSRAPNGKKWLK